MPSRRRSCWNVLVGRFLRETTSPRRQAGLLLALLGAGLLAWAAARGDLRVGFFLIIPYLAGAGLLPFLGFVLLLAGAFLALTAGFGRAAPPPASERAWPPEAHHAAPPREPAERRTRHGGFVLVGPLPIVWGNDRRLLPWLVLLGLGLLLLALLLPALLR